MSLKLCLNGCSTTFFLARNLEARRSVEPVESDGRTLTDRHTVCTRARWPALESRSGIRTSGWDEPTWRALRQERPVSRPRGRRVKRTTRAAEPWLVAHVAGGRSSRDVTCQHGDRRNSRRWRRSEVDRATRHGRKSWRWRQREHRSTDCSRNR